MISMQPGTYVVAVSGGVDSVSLLHMLARQATSLPKGKSSRLVVAHFDHGIRSDSHLDRQLVQGLAQEYGLPFVYTEGKLGLGTSEAVARDARYEFLRNVQKSANAEAIVTAHHQDDVIETAIINILRGTGRKGVSALRDHWHLRRPLLGVSKADLQSYAREQGLLWREDSTNADMTILRNYIRMKLLPGLGPKGRQAMLNNIQHLSVLNRAIDDDLLVYLHLQPSRQALDRHNFIALPHTVALEVMASWLRSHEVRSFDSTQLERIVALCKTLNPGKRIDIDATHTILLGRETIALVNR